MAATVTFAGSYMAATVLASIPMVVQNVYMGSLLTTPYRHIYTHLVTKISVRVTKNRVLHGGDGARLDSDVGAERVHGEPPNNNNNNNNNNNKSMSLNQQQQQQVYEP